jgi:hypothetical protein
MALRCASVGACDHAGVATMNMAVTSSAPCFNVLIILGNPYRCHASRRCNQVRTCEVNSKRMTDEFSQFSWAVSFSVSGSTARGLLLFMNGESFPSNQRFPERSTIEARK